jgi:hypothetical protein
VDAKAALWHDDAERTVNPMDAASGRKKIQVRFPRMR